MVAEAEGRTRWGVFALVAAPCAVAVAVMAAAVLNGVLAASVALAGVPLQLKVDSLDGNGLSLYATSIQPLVGNTLPVAAAGISEAKISGLCLGIGADVPILGPIGIKATSNSDITASNLVLNAESLGGDLKAGNAVVGQDASAFTVGPAANRGAPGTLGLQAETVTLSNVTNKSYGLIAGTLSINGVSINVVPGSTSPC
ncbi:DUF6230 family protein [Pseudonocardia sp. GCM10023141]|uniref:DUF6230 family protein n=1 Tax=Pseudonocardia sp. GCM10023141 TaxID=3252653 RepID=UPI00361EB0E4